tara:strand:- start:10696 stop:11577 length:882 start_codon:yes stop_codon:yes gene_type:complete
MKIIIVFLFFTLSKSLYSSDFKNFIRSVNESQNKALKALDYHAKNIGLENFREQYLTEVSKELFTAEIYSNNKKYIVSKLSYEPEKKAIFSKIKSPYKYLVVQLCEDIESFIQGNQYSSLEKYNSYPTSRLSKPVRANLKKVRLISKVWLFLQKANAEKINETLKQIILKAQQRVLLLAALSSDLPKDYTVTLFLKPKPIIDKGDIEESQAQKPLEIAESDKTIEEIVREGADILTKEPLKSDKAKNQQEWKPREEPSYTGLINMFLNAPSQKQAKQAKYIAPKTLPKPSNDW